jgi:hypothetical protein
MRAWALEEVVDLTLRSRYGRTKGQNVLNFEEEVEVRQERQWWS